MANKYTDFQNGLAMALVAGKAAGGAGVTELTKAEYDALSEEEKNNGKLYFIKDWAEGSFLPENEYSLEEKRIGTWIDGKPIYQKTVILDVPTNRTSLSYSIPHNIENIDAIIRYDAYLTSDNMSPKRMLAFIVTENTTDLAKSYINIEWTSCITQISAKTVGLRIGYKEDMTKIVATIQYTKTTD